MPSIDINYRNMKIKYIFAILALAGSVFAASPVLAATKTLRHPSVRHHNNANTSHIRRHHHKIRHSIAKHKTNKFVKPLVQKKAVARRRHRNKKAKINSILKSEQSNNAVNSILKPKHKRSKRVFRHRRIRKNKPINLQIDPQSNLKSAHKHLKRTTSKVKRLSRKHKSRTVHRKRLHKKRKNVALNQNPTQSLADTTQQPDANPNFIIPDQNSVDPGTSSADTQITGDSQDVNAQTPDWQIPDSSSLDNSSGGNSVSDVSAPDSNVPDSNLDSAQPDNQSGLSEGLSNQSQSNLTDQNGSGAGDGSPNFSMNTSMQSSDSGIIGTASVKIGSLMSVIKKFFWR